MRKALITGVTGTGRGLPLPVSSGQGLSCDWFITPICVFGTLLASGCAGLGVLDKIEMVDGDLQDLSSLIRILADYRPDEVYNLAAQSFVATSWQQPLLTGQVTGIGAGPCPGSRPHRAHRRHGSIRPRPPKCLARSSRINSRKPPLFIRVRPTP